MLDHEDKVQLAKTGANGFAGGTIYGLTLNDWVAGLTILYLCLQIAPLLVKYTRAAAQAFREWRGKKRG